jgi:hypothetical protein
MSAEVFLFPGAAQVDATTILELAKQENLKDVLVIGFDQNGKMFRSTSIDQPNALLWIVERFRYLFHKEYFESHE